MTILDTYTIQLIIVTFCGSLLGESVREVNNNTPIDFIHFIIEFLAGGFMALMTSMILKELFAKEASPLILGFAGFSAFAGRTKSSEIVERILFIILPKSGSAGNSNDSEGNKENGS